MNVSIDIKILGSGCPKCKKLEANVKEACKQLNLKANIEEVQDYSEIASYGVMATPALLVNGEVKAYGRVLEVQEIKKILEGI
jgi:small redox-active disulfide protein 2